MTEVYVENISCEECLSSDALGVYKREDGTFHGTCFSCGSHTNEPYGVVKISKEVEPDESFRSEESNSDLSSSGIHKLMTRRIPLEVCEKFGVRSILNSKGIDTHHFYPVEDHSGGIHYCKRTVEGKKFSWLSSKKPMKFFGQRQAGEGGKLIIITEGACLPPETEVLTRSGWVSLSEYEGSEVMQVTGSLKGEFVRPLSIVDKLFTGNMIERTSNGFIENVTEDHNVARLDIKGNLIKQRADIFKNSHYRIPRTLKDYESGTGVPDDLVRLMVSFQADGTHRASNSKDWGFKKYYKINRLEGLLQNLAIDYVKYPPNSRGMTVFRVYGKHAITLPEWVWSKSFNIETMLSLFSRSNMEVFVREQKWWDGNSIKGRDQDEYNNTDKDTVDAVQLASHIAGYCSTIRSRESSGYTPRLDGSVAEYKKQYQVSLLYSKSHSTVQLRKSNKPAIIPVVNQRVMCLTVPSGYLLTRYKGCISITGNCDTLAAYQMLQKEGKNYRVVSIINGASAAVKDFKDNYDWINSFESIVLAFDQDDPGKIAAKKVSELFPLGKVQSISMSEKDACDMLAAGKSKEFLGAIFNSRKLKVEGIVGVEDLLDKALEPIKWGLSYPFKTLTNATYGLRLKELIGVGAASGAGKSQLTKELIFHIMEEHGLPVGMIMLEEAASLTLKQLAGFKCNKRFHIPKHEGEEQGWTVDELRSSLLSLKDKVYLLDHVGSKSWTAIKEKIRYMVSVFGVKFIVLDNLTALVATEDDEYKSVNTIMAEMASIVQEFDCTIFFISHLRKTQGKGADQGSEVTLNDFKGSGSIVFWSNLIISLERNMHSTDEEEKNTPIIRILKDRYSGEGVGTAFKVKYSKETGRMTEVEIPEWDDDTDFKDTTVNV